MSDQNLRHHLLRVASDLPQGDPTRRKLLGVLAAFGGDDLVGAARRATDEVTALLRRQGVPAADHYNISGKKDLKNHKVSVGGSRGRPQVIVWAPDMKGIPGLDPGAPELHPKALTALQRAYKGVKAGSSGIHPFIKIPLTQANFPAV